MDGTPSPRQKCQCKSIWVGRRRCRQERIELCTVTLLLRTAYRLWERYLVIT